MMKVYRKDRTFLLGAETLVGIDLRDSDLHETLLGSMNLSEANLSNTDLRNADLQGADLRGAKLDFANLSNADLSYANLSNARMIEVNLTGANLTGAVLDRASIVGANLTNANLTHTPIGSADLCGVIGILRLSGGRDNMVAWGSQMVSVGCISLSIDNWLASYVEIGRVYEYSAAEIEEYGERLKFVKSWFERRAK